MKRRTVKKNMLGLLILIAGLMIAAAIFFAASRAKAETEARDTVYTLVTVESGDTLWSLAEHYVPEGISLQKYMDELVRINHISNRNQLRTGSKLVVFYYR